MLMCVCAWEWICVYETVVYLIYANSAWVCVGKYVAECYAICVNNPIVPMQCMFVCSCLCVTVTYVWAIVCIYMLVHLNPHHHINSNILLIIQIYSDVHDNSSKLLFKNINWPKELLLSLWHLQYVSPLFYAPLFHLLQISTVGGVLFVCFCN